MMLRSERELAERRISQEKQLLIGLGVLGVIGLGAPVVFSGQLPNPIKSAFIATGVVAAAAGATISGSAQSEERQQWLAAIRGHQQEVLKSHLKLELEAQKIPLRWQAIHNERIGQIQGELALLQMLRQLPAEQQLYYLDQWDLSGVMPIERAQELLNNQPQQQFVEARAVAVPEVEEDEFVDEPAQSVAATVQGGLKVATVQRQAKPIATASWIDDIASKCAEPDPEKRRFQHLVVNGGSQSGKSTLFSKLLELLILKMSGTESGVQINLIDPKYPKTRWAIKPSFTGFESVEAGVLTAADELDRRKQKCIDAERFGEQHPDFSRYILIVDEWDSVWGEGDGYSDVITSDMASTIRANVLRLMKEGAAYNVMVVVIGQSPLSGTSGFSRSDLSSACQLVLGVEALKWTQDTKFPFKDLKAPLQAEISGYLKDNKRCALVVPNMELPYAREIPRLEISPIDVAAVDSETDPIEPAKPIPKAQHDPTIKPRDLNQSNPSRDLFKALKEWYRRQSPKPTDSQIDSAFRQLAERSEPLPPEQINYLREQLEQ